MIWGSFEGMKGNLKIYKIFIDPNKIYFGNLTGDSFSELSNPNGMLKEIANEALSTGYPAFIEFNFVKDVSRIQQLLESEKKIIIENNNFIKSIPLPIIPASLEFEKTGKAFYKRFFETYDKIEKNIEIVSLFDERMAKDMTERVNFVKHTLLDFVKNPTDKLRNDVIMELQTMSKIYPARTPKIKDILYDLDFSTNLTQQMVNLCARFKKGDFSQEYYQTIETLTQKAQLSGANRKIEHKADTFDQVGDLVIYIQNKLAHSYHIADEFLSKDAEIIKGLSIYEQETEEDLSSKNKKDVPPKQKSTPYGVMLRPISSYSQYVCDVIDLALDAILPYGGISKQALNDYLNTSNGDSLYLTDPEIEAELEKKSKEHLKEFTERRKKFDDDANDNYNKGKNNGNRPDGPLGPN